MDEGHGDHHATAEFLLSVVPTGPLPDRLEPRARAMLATEGADALGPRDVAVHLQGAAWLVTATN